MNTDDIAQANQQENLVSLQIQQTPNPIAQLPLGLPLMLAHSLLV